MSDNSIRRIVHTYYTAWADQDRDRVRVTLADACDFRSPQDRFARADDFLDACWKYSEGLTGVEFLKEVYGDDDAFVVLLWKIADGSTFAGAEYVRANSGRLCEILVVSNSPSFGELVG